MGIWDSITEESAKKAYNDNYQEFESEIYTQDQNGSEKGGIILSGWKTIVDTVKTWRDNFSEKFSQTIDESAQFSNDFYTYKTAENVQVAENRYMSYETSWQRNDAGDLDYSSKRYQTTVQLQNTLDDMDKLNGLGYEWAMKDAYANYIYSCDGENDSRESFGDMLIDRYPGEFEDPKLASEIYNAYADGYKGVVDAKFSNDDIMAQSRLDTLDQEMYAKYGEETVNKCLDSFDRAVERADMDSLVRDDYSYDEVIVGNAMQSVGLVGPVPVMDKPKDVSKANSFFDKAKSEFADVLTQGAHVLDNNFSFGA